MKKTSLISVVIILACLSLVSIAPAGIVTINGYNFELDQFNGATVTYRADGSVTFDGKVWDQATGTDGYTLGELAAGQYGSDPGDQVSLNKRSTPDWLQLNYGTPFEITSDAHTVVIYEISSSNSGVDVEGTSFKISLNGGSLINASAGVATFFPTSAENSNQIVFDLYDFGFVNGDFLNTLYIENIDSGSGTSDPDFIFAGVASIPEPATMALLSLGALVLRRKRK